MVSASVVLCMNVHALVVVTELSSDYKEREKMREKIIVFQTDENGDRPVNAQHNEIYKDPHFKDLVMFYEYFHGDTGRGIGASHQTGWTALIANMINEIY